LKRLLNAALNCPLVTQGALKKQADRFYLLKYETSQ
jgi:hypothetical protein